jgi:hypothetical protein
MPVGCTARPPRIEGATVERVEGPSAMVVVRGRTGSTCGRGLLRFYRLRVVRGEVTEGSLNGIGVPVAALPGLVLDVARTVALDAIGVLQGGWRSS